MVESPATKYSMFHTSLSVLFIMRTSFLLSNCDTTGAQFEKLHGLYMRLTLHT